MKYQPRNQNNGSTRFNNNFLLRPRHLGLLPTCITIFMLKSVPTEYVLARGKFSYHHPGTCDIVNAFRINMGQSHQNRFAICIWEPSSVSDQKKDTRLIV